MTIAIVPIKQLEPNECTMVCLKMVLNYYGIDISLKEINDGIIKAIDGSSYNTEIAKFSVTKGLKADCLAYNLYITDPKDSDLSSTQLIKKLKEGIEHPWFDKDSNLLLVKSTINAIESGVNYIIKKPTAKTISLYLKKNIPIIASVNYAALHNKQGNPYTGHDVVLTGIEDNWIRYIDPEHAKEESINIRDLMFAIISRRAISTSSYLIAIYQ